MTKNRRTAPPNPPRVSRTTIEVDPSWLETEEGRRSIASKLPGDHASRPSRTSRVSDGGRVTIDVQAEWLESGSKPPPESESTQPTKATGKKKPPPLPQPEEPVGRSAIPPPLPPTTRAADRRSTTKKSR